MTSAVYSRQPPTIAPSRLTPKAVEGSAVSANRDAKTTFAVKIGKNATVTEARKRHPDGQQADHDDPGERPQVELGNAGRSQVGERPVVGDRPRTGDLLVRTRA